MTKVKVFPEHNPETVMQILELSPFCESASKNRLVLDNVINLEVPLKLSSLFNPAFIEYIRNNQVLRVVIWLDGHKIYIYPFDQEIIIR